MLQQEQPAVPQNITTEQFRATLTATQRQILDLLGQGLSHAVVASAVGCSPGLITQLMSSEIFSNEVALARSTALTAATKRDRSIEKIEDKLINKLDSLIPYITKPMEVVSALAAVNKMERRGTRSEQSHVINQTIVNLQLPTQLQQRFTKNIAGEVIEVEGKTLTTMPAATLLKQLEHKAGEIEDVNAASRYAKVAKNLPGAVSGQTPGATSRALGILRKRASEG